MSNMKLWHIITLWLFGAVLTIGFWATILYFGIKLVRYAWGT